MESVAIPARALENANRKLEALLELIRPTHGSFSLTAEHMTAALTEIVRVGEWLSCGLARESGGQAAKELEHYWHHLEELRQLLPGVHAQLLTERSRLEAERVHLEAAEAWAKSASR